MMDLPEPQKLFNNPFFAGLVGAVIGLKFAPGISWAERMGNAAAGAGFAGYMAPAMAEWFHLESTNMAGGLAFFMGLFGMSLAAAVWQGIRDVKLGEIISGWLSRRG